MSATEQDRERAVAVLRAAAADGLIQSTEPRHRPEMVDRIAEALADERDRARAPFLALAEGLDGDSPYEGDNGGWKDGSRATERHIADRIRRVARESQ